MTRRFAQDTSVSVEKSKAEIEGLVSRYGATAFASAWQNGQAKIMFEAKNRRIRFSLPLPKKDDKKFTHFRHHKSGSLQARSPTAAIEAWEQACRQSWRALALVIKAKLEAVAAGISEFEDEFLANIVMPSGETVGERIRPQIAIVYERGDMPLMLEGPRQ